MRNLTILLAITMLTGLHGQASAQENVAGDRVQLRQWAQCIAKADRRTARRIALGEADAMGRALRGGFFSRQRCEISGQVTTFAGLTFLGPLSELLLAEDSPHTSDFSWGEHAARLEEEALRNVAELRSDFNSFTSVRSQRSLLGLCLLKRDAVAARQLLAAEIDTAGEKQAVTALTEAFEACITQNYPAAMTFDDLRSSVAIALYRIQTAEKEDADA